MSQVIGFPLLRMGSQRRGTDRLREEDGRQGADIVILPTVRIERHGSTAQSASPPQDGTRRTS